MVFAAGVPERDKNNKRKNEYTDMLHFMVLRKLLHMYPLGLPMNGVVFKHYILKKTRKCNDRAR